MKKRANNGEQTIEDQILVDATEAMQGINQLKSGIASLKKQIDDFYKSSGQNINQQKKQTDSLLGTIKKTISFGAIYASVKKGLGALREMTDEAVNYTETVNLFNVSFGKGIEGLNQYYEQALDFQERLEEKLGINIEESMRYQALFNSMTKSMGLSANYAYTLSENMTQLGYDLASLYNIDPTSAMTKLRAGLAGQTEPLRELGLDITEQSLKPVAESLGIDRSIRNMSQAEKAALRYIAVLRQATIAQGDFARTMDSPANQLRIFNAQVTAFKRNMGNLWQGILGGILPYVNAVMMVINELLKMVAKLFGFEVASQPVNISANIGADDLSSDLGDASKNAKELKNQLMGFDEINNISLDNKSSGSSSDSNGVGIDKRLLDAIDDYDNLMDSVSNKATEIRDKMLAWLGFKRNDDGTWKLKEGLTNFEKILDIVKTIGVAIGTWKISSTITNILKNLGILKGKQNFQIAFGLTLALTGIMAQWQGTSHLLAGDVDLFTILETLLGTAGGTFGIVSILKATKLGKTLSLGNKIKIGLGVSLAIQGIQVLADGINTGDIKKTIAGALETAISGTITLKTLLGNQSISNAINTITKSLTTFGNKAKNVFGTVISSASTFGSKLGSAFKGGTTGIKNFVSSLTKGTSGMSSFVKTGGKMIAGLAGITGGSALAYATMKDFATGAIESEEASLKLATGLGIAGASGAIAGSQFGTVGTIVGGLAGIMTSAITAYVGWKNGVESMNIPVTELTDDIAELTQELKNNRQASKNAMNAIKDTYESQMVEAEYASELSEQLEKLVDTNGKVIQGNEDRVALILGELNKALGTEYDLNGNIITQNGQVIESYEKLRQDIDKTIAKKKEEAEQTAINDLYVQSVKNRIQADRDLAKAKQEYTKAEIEYNELMAKGLDTWTLEHDESCKQILQNYIDMGKAVEESVKEKGEAYMDEAYYQVEMSKLSDKTTDLIIKNTQKITAETIEQKEITSEELQRMSKENLEEWTLNYNGLDAKSKEFMLAQSTTLDTWSPTLQQKWKDMAVNSTANFKNAISMVTPEVQAQILSSIAKTEELTPAIQQAWINLANRSEISYRNALSGLDDETARKIQEVINTANAKQESVSSSFTRLATGALSAFSVVDGYSSGANLVAGVERGVNANKYRVINAVRGLATGAQSAFNIALGIYSPSRVMEAEAKNIPLGVIKGIKDKEPEVYTTMRELSQGIKVNTEDFMVDTNQYVNYDDITGQVSMSINKGQDIGRQVYEAIIRGMQQVSIPIEIEARTDEGIIFNKVREKAEEFATQTGENPFPVLA